MNAQMNIMNGAKRSSGSNERPARPPLSGKVMNGNLVSGGGSILKQRDQSAKRVSSLPVASQLTSLQPKNNMMFGLPGNESKNAVIDKLMEDVL